MRFDEIWKLTKDIELVQVRDVEMEAMYNACSQFKHPLVLEIGCTHGASTTVFAEALRDFGGGGGLYCIDNFIEDYYGQDKFGEYAYRAFKRNVLYKYDVHFYKMSSKDAIGRVSAEIPKLIDVLFVDGDHSYEAVIEDCENYIPLVAVDGFIGFHDYNNPAFGVKKAVDEFSKQSRLQKIEKVGSFWDLAVFKKI